MNQNSWSFPQHIPEPLSDCVQRMIKAALNAVNPANAVITQIVFDGARLLVNGKHIMDYPPPTRIMVVAIGKAALEMVYGLNQALGERITKGIVVTKHARTSVNLPESKYSIFYGNHPVPSGKSVDAANAVLSFLKGCSKDDVVFFLISGGGSSLVCLPEEPLTLEDIRSVTSTLLTCGVTIQEMNIIRKHLDRVKGGKIAAAVTGMCKVSLVISDVVDNSLTSIASGPTVADPSTFQDVQEIFSRYNLWDKVPETVKKFVLDGVAGLLPETIKEVHPAFTRSEAFIIASNRNALYAAKVQAENRGFKVMIDEEPFTGEAGRLGENLIKKARRMQQTSIAAGIPACVIFGGESTVTIRGTGKGGRNLELALGSLQTLAKNKHEYLVTLATDGEDGPTDAAGACISSSTLKDSSDFQLKAEQALKNNNSYGFFQETGLLIKTGPTGTNVNDLVFWFYYP